jgi:hypothetical protein
VSNLVDKNGGHRGIHCCTQRVCRLGLVDISQGALMPRKGRRRKLEDPIGAALHARHTESSLRKMTYYTGGLPDLGAGSLWQRAHEQRRKSAGDGQQN